MRNPISFFFIWIVPALLISHAASGEQRTSSSAVKKPSTGSTAVKPAPKKTSNTAMTEDEVPKDNKAPANTPISVRKTAVAWQTVLKVVNPADTREQIENAARALGGHPTYFDDKRILVKIPHAALSGLTERIAKMGLLLQKTIHREDLTLRIAELEGRLKSKKEILARTRGFLDDADMAATLDIEQTMTQLVAETEAIRGELRVLYDRAAYADVAVDFEFRERDKVLYIDSPFEWLNTVDLNRFVQEF